MRLNGRKPTKQNGFTILQLVVTIAIIGVVSTFGVLGIRNARAEYRLQNSARQLAVYLEKARGDAIRRHAAPGNESWVETFGPGTTTYNVRMDFGSGSMETRTFQLESGVSFTTNAQRTTFDWRGRISSFWVYQVFNGDKAIPVDVSGSGDVTVGGQHFPDELIPAVSIASVTGDVVTDPTPTPTPVATPDTAPPPAGDPGPSPSPSPTSTPNGNGNGNGNGNTNPNGNPHSSPSPTPTPLPSPSPSPTALPSPTATPLPPCVASIYPPSLSLSQSITSKKTGTVTLSIANASTPRIISASQAGGGNSLTISLSQARIEGSGTSVITIGTKNGAGNRGTFTVDVSASPTCGQTQHITVSVSN